LSAGSGEGIFACNGLWPTPESPEGVRPWSICYGAIALLKQVTPAQISLPWLLAQNSWFVPISGTTKPHRLEQSIGRLKSSFTSDEVREIAPSQIHLEENDRSLSGGLRRHLQAPGMSEWE
jgi:hypothetical protein